MVILVGSLYLYFVRLVDNWISRQSVCSHQSYSFRVRSIPSVRQTSARLVARFRARYSDSLHIGEPVLFLDTPSKVKGRTENPVHLKNRLNFWLNSSGFSSGNH